jgi:hypothetical protein
MSLRFFFPKYASQLFVHFGLREEGGVDGEEGGGGGKRFSCSEIK